METQELIEAAEKIHTKRERAVGVTMAIIAAFLASVTLAGHRLHTEEVVLQTKAADGWAYYQAKDGRYHMYEADAKLAGLIGSSQGPGLAEAWNKKAEEEHQQAEMIRTATERLDEETQAAARHTFRRR